MNNLVLSFINESIFVDDLDYYHTNTIARASKTMNECRVVAKHNALTHINETN